MPIAFQIEHHSDETDRLSRSWTIRADFPTNTLGIRLRLRYNSFNAKNAVDNFKLLFNEKNARKLYLVRHCTALQFLYTVLQVAERSAFAFVAFNAVHLLNK